MSLSSEIATFVADTHFGTLPPRTLYQTKRSILDSIAVMVAGAREPSAQAVRSYIASTAGPGQAIIVGTRLRVSSPQAALANGVAGHALEYDDTQLSPSPEVVYGLLMHPTVPILSAVLALGEKQPIAGRDVVTAVAIGVEVACKLAARVSREHYTKGFHVTGTMGTFGAVAAAAKTLGLSASETANALGIGASAASGVRANFGTMMKSVHAGWAAQNGVDAALMTLAGVTASPAAADGGSGFLEASSAMSGALNIGTLGSPYTVEDPGLAVKAYPCGTMAQPAMDVTLGIVRANEIAADQIREIRVGVNSMAQRGLFFTAPKTGTQARFSMQHCVAVIAADRKAGLEQFSEARLLDPDLIDLTRRVSVYVDPASEAQGYARMPTNVEIVLVDGSSFIGTADVPSGHPERPMSDEGLRGKVANCLGSSMGSAPVDELIAQTMDLERLDSILDWKLYGLR